MTAALLDGKMLAESLRAAVRTQALAFHERNGRAPGLDVVLVGADPASQVYTRSKEKASNEAGMRGRLHTLPAETTERHLLALLARLNADDAVDGILVQLPLPPQIDALRVLDAIDPKKDVDGFHPVNAGLLAAGRPALLVPCTPVGCMALLDASGVDAKGLRAVVLGRSSIVGRPVAQLLLARNATVTLAHSHTRDLASVCREADILVAAVGKPEMVRGDWVKEGAVVLDVGITRLDAGVDASGKARTRLVGDVAFDEAKERARAITPVPGGVGPMTVACLLENTLKAATARVASRG
jgi:methylenetetrahydrofolate dehydrogenase (NADP+)/methenyltetrahydrofolate cyclohydrolase